MISKTVLGVLTLPLLMTYLLSSIKDNYDTFKLEEYITYRAVDNFSASYALFAYAIGLHGEPKSPVRGAIRVFWSYLFLAVGWKIVQQAILKLVLMKYDLLFDLDFLVDFEMGGWWFDLLSHLAVSFVIDLLPFSSMIMFFVSNYGQIVKIQAQHSLFKAIKVTGGTSTSVFSSIQALIMTIKDMHVKNIAYTLKSISIG